MRKIQLCKRPRCANSRCASSRGQFVNHFPTSPSKPPPLPFPRIIASLWFIQADYSEIRFRSVTQDSSGASRTCITCTRERAKKICNIPGTAIRLWELAQKKDMQTPAHFWIIILLVWRFTISMCPCPFFSDVFFMFLTRHLYVWRIQQQKVYWILEL